MNSFEKLFVNSTNRISSLNNFTLSTCASATVRSSTPSLNQFSAHNKNPLLKQSCAFQDSSETFQQLQLKYQELNKSLKQANKQRQMMSDLFDIIFKVQQGQEQQMKKRIRRKKGELQSKHQCKIPTCKKAYTSSASLLRHSKLKHVYAKFEPPSHNYQIPPSPNLNHSNAENRPSDMKETLEKEGEDSEEEGAANELDNHEDLYEADCEQSEEESHETDES